MTEKKIEYKGEKLDASDLLYQRGANYGMFVIQSRALPDARDGLKPVHRRIIWGMAEKGLYWDKPYKKSATSVGEIMGYYHPHGDSAIYEAMGLMAQDFSTNVPLIDGQGNFGSVDGDPLASSRYTEARLTRMSSRWLQDCKEGIVEFRPNFSEDKVEPVVMSVDYPNLLVNGTSGIAWGLSCDFPSHNIGEAIEATLVLLNKPNASLKELMKKMPAPDFPAGSILTNPDELEELYKNGKGKLTLQSKMHVEPISKSQQAVVVTQMPPGVKPSEVAHQIAVAAQKGQITEVTDKVINNLDKDGLKFIIRCKKGGNPDVLVQQLLNYTQLRINKRVDMTAIKDKLPKTFSLIELIQTWIDFRMEVIENRLKLERKQLLKELDRYQAQRAALDNIDKVISIIKNSDDNNDTKDKLIKLLKVKPYQSKKLVHINEAQAQYIMDMRLIQINKLNQFDLDEKIKLRFERIKEIDLILADKELMKDIIREELKEIKKLHPQKRRTTLSSDVLDQPIQEFEAQEIMVWLGEKAGVVGGTLKPRNSSPLTGEETVWVGKADNLNDILIHTEQGYVTRVNLRELPVDDRKKSGKKFFNISGSDKVVSAHTDTIQQTHIAWITNDGLIKRMETELVLKGSDYAPKLGMNPKEGKVIDVIPHNADQELLVHTKQGKALRIKFDNVNPVKSLSASGVALMKVSGDDEIISATVINKEHDTLLMLHAQGSGKLGNLNDYPVKGRGGQGIASADPSKPTNKPSGEIAVVHSFNKKEPMQLLTKGGVILDLAFNKNKPVTRATMSKPMIDLGMGDIPKAIIKP